MGKKIIFYHFIFTSFIISFFNATQRVSRKIIKDHRTLYTPVESMPDIMPTVIIIIINACNNTAPRLPPQANAVPLINASASDQHDPFQQHLRSTRFLSPTPLANTISTSSGGGRNEEERTYERRTDEGRTDEGRTYEGWTVNRLPRR